MFLRSALSLIAVAVYAAGCASTPSDALTAHRHQGGDEPKGGAAPAMPSPEAMAEMAAPVDQHRQLQAGAGVWDADVTMWMDPSAPPMVSKGVSTRRSINNGLYLTDEFASEMMGMKFTGFGVHGYSKDKKQWFGLWCDSMSTQPEVMWGTADASGKVITFDGSEMTCPMGKFMPRWIVRNIDADHSSFEHWSKLEGAPDYVKEIEVKYTRRK